MKPLLQKKLIFINKCNCIFDEILLEKAMFWYAKGNLKQVRNIYLHGSYPAVSIFNKKIHIHRLIKSFSIGKILPSSECVHHKNGSKLDARLCNLEIINNRAHASLHNTGKQLSNEHKEKISFRNRERKGIKYTKKRKDITITKINELIIKGFSVNRIAKTLKTDWSTIKNRIHETPKLLK